MRTVVFRSILNKLAAFQKATLRCCVRAGVPCRIPRPLGLAARSVIAPYRWRRTAMERRPYHAARWGHRALPFRGCGRWRRRTAMERRPYRLRPGGRSAQFSAAGPVKDQLFNCLNLKIILNPFTKIKSEMRVYPYSKGSISRGKLRPVSPR